MSIELKVISLCLIFYLLMTPFQTVLFSEDTYEQDNGWLCPECGEWNDEEYNFCTNCGAERPAQSSQIESELQIMSEEDSLWVCPYCDEENKTTNDYCVNCGRKRVMMPQSQTSDVIFGEGEFLCVCPECGEENDFNNEVCLYCREPKPHKDSPDYKLLMMKEENKSLVSAGKWIMRIGGVILGAGGVSILIGLSTGNIGAAFTAAFLGIIGAPVLGTGFVLYIIGKVSREKVPLTYNIDSFNDRNYDERPPHLDTTYTIFSFCINL